MAGRLRPHVDKLGVDKCDCFLVGHGFGVQIEHGHERRYLILVHSPVSC